MITSPRTFKKAERLCSRKTITGLFGSGKVFYTAYFRVLWAETDGKAVFPARVAFMVPKKVFRNAVARNLLKRKMREAYRKNKYILYDFLNSQNMNIDFVVIYRKDRTADFSPIESAVIEMLERLKTETGPGSRKC